MALTLFSEPFSGSGGASANSQIRAFEANELSPRESFLRETVQNAWDARLNRDSHGSIDFAVDWRHVGPNEQEQLRTEVFSQIPDEHQALRVALQRPGLEMLLVSDRGTRGLGGPTNAAVEPPQDSRTDYRDFVLDLGREDDKEIGGGTYGIGKAVWFTVSRARTLLIYSQTRDGGILEHRLIAVASADSFVRSGHRYTGRHRWGVPSSAEPNSLVEPLTGHSARKLALELGLTELEAHETGTSIAVLSPTLFGDETPRSAMADTVEAAVVWTWPHLVREDNAGRRAPSIRYKFSVYGDVLSLPDPLVHAKTRSFAQAYSMLDELRVSPDFDSSLVQYDAIEMRLPMQKLGELVQVQASRDPNAAGLSGATIALMRKPRFIVKYWTVAVPSSEFDSFGVFVADASSEADEVFARSEPVAHNDWIPEKVQQPRRANPVRKALKEIQNAVKRLHSAGRENRVGIEHAGLPRLAREFAAVLSAEAGSGASRPTRGGTQRRPASPRRPLSVRLEEEVQYVRLDGDELAEFEYTIIGDKLALQSRELIAVPWIELGDGSREAEPPSGETAPTIHSWAAVSGAPAFATGARVLGTALPTTSGVVRVTLPGGAAVGLRVDINESTGAMA